MRRARGQRAETPLPRRKHNGRCCGREDRHQQQHRQSRDAEWQRPRRLSDVEHRRPVADCDNRIVTVEIARERHRRLPGEGRQVITYHHSRDVMRRLVRIACEVDGVCAAERLEDHRKREKHHKGDKSRAALIRIPAQARGTSPQGGPSAWRCRIHWRQYRRLRVPCAREGSGRRRDLTAVCQPVNVVFVDEKPRASVRHRLGDAAVMRRDDGKSRCHALHNRHRHTFDVSIASGHARREEHVRGMQKSDDVSCRLCADEPNLVVSRLFQLPVARDCGEVVRRRR